MTTGRAIILLIGLVFSASFAASAQRTTRSKLRPAVSEQSKAKADFDTVFTAADSAQIIFSGYEKTLRSTKESFFVNNRTDSLIDRLIIAISYKDMSGRELDRRTAEIDITVEPAATRRVDLPAWDKQKVFYYYLSPAPRSGRATPYKVTITPVAALRRR